MKTLAYCTSSFALGALIAGFLGYILFIHSIQSSNVSEMRTFSQSVSLLTQGNEKNLKAYHCANLETSLSIFEDLQGLFLSSKKLFGTEEQTNKFILEVKEQLSNEGVCKHALQNA
ncbi:hypothetical protein [Alteromonas sp. P256]|uniref:hypothetical protein n=1 Tax=Alteromonas sp. P256 TaxID=3117399 RepID=UPI002FE13587